MSSLFGLNADDLRLLAAVARTGRMVATAAALGIDHTTVSRRIRRLEALVGTSLLVRSADGWELTELGRIVAAKAREIDATVDAIEGLLSEDSHALRGTVRVAAPDGFGVLFGAPALANVVRQHPGVVPELITSSRPVSSRGSGFDLAVNVGPRTSIRTATERLAQYTLGLYASRGYLREAGTEIRRIDDLRAHPLVFYVDALLTVAELDLARSFSGTRVGFASTNVLAQVAATQAGAGVGLLPHFLAAATPDLIPVLPSEVRFELEYSLSVRYESRDSPLVLAVREALHREVEARGEELRPK